ncbi:MAG: c-type cytochrome [Magnetococcus sp. DMHC-8]
MRKTVTLSLGLALLALAGLSGRAEAGGEQIFNDKKCTDCHYTQGPAREKTVADRLAQKGPELWYAGEKFQEAWLTGWLADPKPIRPLKFNSLTDKNAGDHPKLSADEAKEVSAFLMGLKSGTVKAGEIQPKNNPKGKQIFTKTMPCSGCHTYPEKDSVVGGLSAPSLAGAGARLNPDWIYAYLANPKLFKPVKMMPVFTELLKEDDMKKVAAHVASF